MATEQDAARDRVLAARADLGEQLQILEASGRAAIDIKAKVRRNPARAAAIAGGVGFLALRGPQRIIRGTRRAIFGPPKPMPKTLLPEEVEKTLRSLGEDGDQVRAVLERDFALYVKKAEKGRLRLRTILTVAVARPLVLAVSKRAAAALLAPESSDFAARLAEVRARAERGIDQLVDPTQRPDAASPSASETEPPAGL